MSLSQDGIKKPELIDGIDYINLYVGKQSYTPSELVSIDDVPAVDYIAELGSRSNSQDPDSQYNTMFITPALISKGREGGFSLGYFRNIPDESIYKFANGTTLTVQNYALVGSKALDGITSGELFHKKFEIPASTTESPKVPSSTESVVPSQPTEPTKPTSTPLIGYPLPVVETNKKWISGYFLDSPEFKDVAVLSLVDFAPVGDVENSSDPDLTNAQATIAAFISACKAQNKTKLVIDVSSNGGGFLLSGYDAFAQLFPSKDIWGGSRLRSNKALQVIGKFAEQDKTLDNILETQVDAQLKPYPNFDAIFGPELVHGQNTTRLLRYDFNKNVSEPNYYVSGFGPKGSISEPPFSPENIIVVTDGICASTCTIFIGLLTREHGIRTVALGGRPLELPMQAIGGVKGSQVLNYKDLQGEVARMFTTLNGTGATIDLAVLPSILDAPLEPVRGGRFNYRNAYSREEPNGYPLQFVYEASNCKLFYTPDMIKNVTNIWTRVADVAWKGGRCVAGSTVNQDGTISSKTPAFDKRTITSVPATNGPGSLAFDGEYVPMPKRSIFKRETISEMLSQVGDLPNHKMGPAIGAAKMQ
jgi:hypothetical protein